MNVTATLFVQVLTFVGLVWFVWNFLWDPLIQLMDSRTQRIADGLAAADDGQRKLQEAEKEIAEQVRVAKQQGAEIIAQAQRRADEIVEDAKSTAKLEGQRQIDAAQAEIEQEVNRAKEHLRGQYSTLVLDGVEKILEKEVNAAAHNDLVDKLVEQI